MTPFFTKTNAMVSMQSRQNAGLKSFDDYPHTMQSSAKSILKFGILNLSAIFLVVYSSLFLLDGVGTIFCGKNEFYSILHSVNSRQGSECPSALHIEEKSLTKLEKKNKFAFWKKRKNKNRMQNEISESINEDSAHKNNDLCYNIALTLSNVAKIAPLSRYRNFEQTTKSSPIQEIVAKEKPSKSKNPLKRFKKKTKKKTKTDSPKSSYYFKYTDAHIKLAQELASTVKSKMSESDLDFNDRLNAIAWGGPGSEGSPWWGGKKKGKGIEGDGVNLMLSYLKIMDFPKARLISFFFPQ